MRIGTRVPTTYSQNFLKSCEFVKRLIQKSSVSSTDKVIEIGAGGGIITKELAKTCKEVVAYELDPLCYKQASKELAQYTNVKLINENFLNTKLPQGAYKVFSNIPFNLTSRIIRKLTETENPPEDAYLIIQKEAAYKYMGLFRETQVSLLLKPWFEIKVLAQLGRGMFYPKPYVDIVLLNIKSIQPLVEERNKQLYKDFIVHVTNQWKPTLYESLNKIFTKKQLNRIIGELHLTEECKPLDVSFVKYLKLFELFLRLVDVDKQGIVAESFNRQRQLDSRIKKVYRSRVDKNWKSKY